MKNFTYLFLFTALSALTATFSYAQVGMGTTDPQADLHVTGNTLVQKEFELPTLPFVSPVDEGFKLLTWVKNSTPKGKITILDVDQLQVAPINTIDYEFKNISSDNLKDVDLQYDASKYVVGIANFRYVGDAIKKKSVNGQQSVGAFVTRTFISNGTWHLEIGNRFLDLEAGKSLTYFVTLIVYDNSYYRNLPAIITNLNGSNTGTASAVPNLYN